MSLRLSYHQGEFCWVDILARDAKALQAFYSELFGWSATLRRAQKGQEYVIFESEGKKVCGISQMPMMIKMIGTPTMWNSYISVEDAAKVADNALKLGGSVVLPPMDMSSAGRVAFLKDPQGSLFAVWQKGELFGAELAAEPGSWAGNELLCANSFEAKKFYEALFGWSYPAVAEEDSTCYCAVEHAGLKSESWCAIQGAGHLKDRQTGWKVVFAVRQLAPALEKLRSLGGKVITEPFMIGGKEFAVVQDPQGAEFMLQSS